MNQFELTFQTQLWVNIMQLIMTPLVMICSVLYAFRYPIRKLWRKLFGKKYDEFPIEDDEEIGNKGYKKPELEQVAFSTPQSLCDYMNRMRSPYFSTFHVVSSQGVYVLFYFKDAE